jgi:hypothetical protein
MVAPPTPISLYATRWKSFLLALVFAGVIVMDWLWYLVWPVPDVTMYPLAYQEPGKTIYFTVALLVSAALVATGLYWTFTSRPVLRLSVSELIYRPFPLPLPWRTISWDDIESVSVDFAWKHVPLGQLTHGSILIFWLTYKPHRSSASSAQPPLEVHINMRALSLQADELVKLIGIYHAVEWLG